MEEPDHQEGPGLIAYILATFVILISLGIWGIVEMFKHAFG